MASALRAPLAGSAQTVRQPVDVKLCMDKIFTALFAIFIFQASTHAAEKIRIGFPDLAAPFVPLAVGQQRGFFQEEGLQAELIRMNPTIAFPALVGGEIDYYTVTGPGVAAAIRGVPVRLVASYVPAGTTALIARPEFKSVQELRGKTIGINAYGGALEAMARLIFQHSGLNPDKDVKFLSTGPTESRFAAMKQGLTVATLGGPPIDFLGQKLGFVVVARANELFSFPVSGPIASGKKIKERRPIRSTV